MSVMKRLRLLVCVGLAVSLAAIGYAAKKDYKIPELKVPVYPPEIMQSFIAAGYGEQYYLAADFIIPEQLEAFYRVISGEPEPIVVHKFYRIALIMPSLDLSDAWYCGWVALEARLKELGIRARVDTFGTAHADHEKMAGYIDAAIAARYDYIIVAPTELMTMKKHLEKIMDAGIPLIVWNNTTPFREWGTERRPRGGQPLAWVNFDHGYMGLLVGMKVAERLPPNANIVLLRGVPGVVDWQRSEIPKVYWQLLGHNIVYEAHVDWDYTKAYTQTKAALAAHPKVDFIYCASTAIAYGAIAALKELGLAGQILVNGQGGGPGEQAHMWDRNLCCTAFRMQDDWGVALAEIIKYHIMRRIDEVPLVITPPMTVIHMDLTPEDVAGYTAYAFRYSGVREY